MTDVQRPRSEWAVELEKYGATFVREAQVFDDGVVNEVWKAHSGETFLMPYVVGAGGARFTTQAVVVRRIRDLLSLNPAGRE